MAKRLILFLSDTSKACCLYGFLKQPKYADLTNKQLAKKLGVSERTLRDDISLIKNGAVRCRKKENCLCPNSKK